MSAIAHNFFVGPHYCACCMAFPNHIVTTHVAGQGRPRITGAGTGKGDDPNYAVRIYATLTMLGMYAPSGIAAAQADSGFTDLFPAFSQKCGSSFFKSWDDFGF